MTDQTLHDLIELALANKWSCFDHADQERFRWRLEDTTLFVNYIDPNGTPCCEQYSLEQIIFNVPWAKAVFGEEAYEHMPFMPVWAHHMKQYAPMTNEERTEYLQRWMDERRTG